MNTRTTGRELLRAKHQLHVRLNHALKSGDKVEIARTHKQMAALRSGPHATETFGLVVKNPEWRRRLFGGVL